MFVIIWRARGKQGEDTLFIMHASHTRSSEEADMRSIQFRRDTQRRERMQTRCRPLAPPLAAAFWALRVLWCVVGEKKKADCGMTKQILKASNSNSAVPFGGTGQVVDRRRRARTEGGRVGFGIRALAPSVLALQAKHSSVRLSPPEPIRQIAGELARVYLLQTFCCKGVS